MENTHEELMQQVFYNQGVLDSAAVIQVFKESVIDAAPSSEARESLITIFDSVIKSVLDLGVVNELLLQ